MSLLDISPKKEIEFPVTNETSVSRQLTLINVSPAPVAFKIKTTAPKDYLVRPSSGIVPADETVAVQLILQSSSPGRVGSANDRFLVQAVPYNESSESLSKDFWNHMSKDDMCEHKLTVVFKADPVAVVTSTPPPDKDIVSRYNEMLMYTTNCEKDIDQLKQKLQKAETATASAQEQLKTAREELSRLQHNTGGVVVKGFELKQVIVLIVVSILLGKLLRLL
ncbi:MAG: hypothetical protein KVP17_004401 [Porospora cf. gigantea B]|uniref:uncharacterized protein n=1 Tax=Porospora cf. gigantea B TaxID=2853592 RepID=UPI003571EA59|nr:MAG: hypothetical protein KVP17_004401 [Porospora cf. gigantea B]